MFVEPIYALMGDVQRLLAAGSASAAIDEGLRKHLSLLRPLGEHVPVLGRVADAVERLCHAPPEKAAMALLDLLVLLRQVLSGVLSSGVSGELEKISPSGPWRTTAPADVVGAAAQALSSKGSGRDQAVLPLADQPGRADLRLLDGFLRQLDDSYAALADFVAERILPHFGRPILAELQAHYDPRGGASQGRRLLAMAHIDARVGRKLALEGIRQGSPAVRWTALRVLAVVDSKEARRAAIEVLTGKDKPRLKLCAVETLERIKAFDAETIAVLVRALVDEDFSASHKAQSVLGTVGRAAVPALIELLQGPDPEGRRKAIWVLRAIGPEAVEAVPALIAALEDSTPLYGASIPRCAMSALAAIGPAAGVAVVPLTRFLDSSDPRLRFDAAEALLKITGECRQCLPVLIEALSSPNIHLRRDAALALEQIGPPAKAAVPALIAALKDRKGNIRHFAAAALGRIGYNAKEVVPLLIPMVNEQEWYIRFHAICALGYFGPKARAALPVLREAAKDRAQYVQKAIDPALASIEGCGPAS